MSPLLRYDANGLQIWEGDALAVAPTLPESSFSLAIFDGPYFLGKADWDKGKLSDLPRWYRPHIEAAGRILSPSSSLYLWNTAEGWATLHPLMVSMGWTFRTLIVWEKNGAHPALISAANSSKWPDITEVCGHYQRGDAYHLPEVIGNVWTFSPTAHMRKERLMSETMAINIVRGHMEDKKAKNLNYVSLHPCQKPLLFADRMIRASTRPGERVWVPFGGTCREAIAADKIRRSDPTEAREVVTCELNQDGPDYLDPVIRILNGEGSAPIDKRQPQLF